MRLRTFLGYGGVLFAALHLSCHPAPTPTPGSDPYAEVKAQMGQMNRELDQSNIAMDQLICRLHGTFATEFVRKRDIEHEPLEVVLARLDKTERSTLGEKAMGDLVRKAAIQVYAHPAWTAADVFTYAEQDCIRWKQETSQATAVQSHCRFAGTMAAGLVRRRDIDRATRGAVLADYDRALRSPYVTDRDKAIIASHRQLAVQVYAHPAWTAADARTYAVQECLRANTR